METLICELLTTLVEFYCIISRAETIGISLSRGELLWNNSFKCSFMCSFDDSLEDFKGNGRLMLIVAGNVACCFIINLLIKLNNT